MKPTFVLATLLAAYVAVGLRGYAKEVADAGRFDPFLPLARAVEWRIGERRFAEALPIARRLRQIYPAEPLVAYWLARIHHGLEAPQAEAAAWEDYIRLSAAPEEACPSLPEAYARLGRAAESLAAYERCARLSAEDGEDSDRLLDLAEAYGRAGQAADARRTLERAHSLDPDNPLIRERLGFPYETPR
jgi:tetratricopeptide (TPR) repeat protein